MFDISVRGHPGGRHATDLKRNTRCSISFQGAERSQANLLPQERTLYPSPPVLRRGLWISGPATPTAAVTRTSKNRFPPPRDASRVSLGSQAQRPPQTSLRTRKSGVQKSKEPSEFIMTEAGRNLAGLRPADPSNMGHTRISAVLTIRVVCMEESRGPQT